MNGVEYTWEITTERVAKPGETKKRYDLILWRAVGKVILDPFAATGIDNGKCPAKLKSGDRKGERCGRPSTHGLFCGLHVM